MAPAEQSPTTRSATSTLVDSIAAVELRVRSIPAAAAFYCTDVGLELGDLEAHRAELRTPGGPVRLRLRSRGVEGPSEAGVTGLFHTAFLFPGRPSLGDALARLVEAGHSIGAGDHGVSEALYVDDPDGNGVELYRDRPVHEWPRTGSGGVDMYTRPVDLDDLLASRSGEGADAAGPVVGHVHFRVADVAETVRFYVDGLGLDLVARMGDQAAFMSSGGYHHHVGANSWSSRGCPPASPERAGLDRVEFAAGNASELRNARARLEHLGYEVGGDDGGLVVRDPDDIELRLTARP
jgi:catechol 2,3-dioxygenase